MGEIWGAFVSGMTSVIKFFASITGDHTAIGIILFTICVRLLMLPLTLKAVRSSRAMQQLQPLIKEINKRYEPKKGERLSPEKTQAKQAETMKLYSEYSINPAASCLPILIQLPLFFAVYSAVRGALGDPDPLIQHITNTWHTFANATGASTSTIISDNAFPFFWLKSLSLPDPIYILPILMVFFQFTTQKMAMPRGGGADEQQRRINGIMQWTPLIFGFTALNFPAGPVVYWVTTSMFSAVRQFFITGWGGLADVPGLGFLPAKKLATIALKRREEVPGAPPRKSWMERMQERQQEIQAKGGTAKVLPDGKNSKADVIIDAETFEDTKKLPSRTSARINNGNKAAADASNDTDWQDDEVNSSADSGEKTANDASARHSGNSNRHNASTRISGNSTVQSNYNQLNRRPPKRPNPGNNTGGSRKKR